MAVTDVPMNFANLLRIMIVVMFVVGHHMAIAYAYHLAVWTCDVSLVANIGDAISYPIVVMVDSLFRLHFGLVPILVVYRRMDRAIVTVVE